MPTTCRECRVGFQCVTVGAVWGHTVLYSIGNKEAIMIVCSIHHGVCGFLLWCFLIFWLVHGPNTVDVSSQRMTSGSIERTTPSNCWGYNLNS